MALFVGNLNHEFLRKIRMCLTKKLPFAQISSDRVKQNEILELAKMVLKHQFVSAVTALSRVPSLGRCPEMPVLISLVGDV